MKRKWSGAPKWVDYLAQILYGASHKVDRVSAVFSVWASELLDAYCQCEFCKKRAEK